MDEDLDQDLDANMDAAFQDNDAPLPPETQPGVHPQVTLAVQWTAGEEKEFRKLFYRLPESRRQLDDLVALHNGTVSRDIRYEELYEAAAAEKSPKLLEWLFMHPREGFDINEAFMDDDGNETYLLSVAVSHGQLENFRLLLSHGARAQMDLLGRVVNRDDTEFLEAMAPYSVTAYQAKRQASSFLRDLVKRDLARKNLAGTKAKLELLLTMPQFDINAYDSDYGFLASSLLHGRPALFNYLLSLPQTNVNYSSENHNTVIHAAFSLLRDKTRDERPRIELRRGDGAGLQVDPPANR